MKILECTGLYKRYGKQDVITDLSFSANKGEVLALLGPNGAGKTTVIKIILGLAAPDKGEVRFIEGIRTGYSPETPYFHPFLTGYEVLYFYSRLQKIEKAKAKEQIAELLKMTGLEKAGEKKVKTYSKGMLQRLAMAQALLGNPDMVILDEPASGLDTIGRIELINLIAVLKQKGKTIMINSHILSDLEKVADRAVFIVSGKNAGEAELHSNRDTDLEKLFILAAGGGKHECSDPERIQ